MQSVLRLANGVSGATDCCVEGRMVIFASFNGGPSDQAVLLAFIASGITGPIVGGISRRPLIGFAVGTLCDLVISGVVLVRGNQPGDGASF